MDELRKDIQEVYVADSFQVAEWFVDQYVAGSSREEQIKAVAELIRYKGNLNEICAKMVLGDQ